MTGILVRVVLEVGILTMMMSPFASANPRRSAAPLPWFSGCKNTRTRASSMVCEHIGRAIGGPVVHDDELDIHVELDSQHPADDFLDGVPLVEDGHHH